MKKDNFAFWGLVISLLAVLAVLAAPVFERWLDARSLSIEVVEPVRLNLAKNSEVNPNLPSSYLTVLLIRNSGNTALESLRIPIAFDKINASEISHFEVSNSTSFQVWTKIDQTKNILQVESDFINPGESVNLAIISQRNPGYFMIPRIKNVNVSITKGVIERRNSQFGFLLFLISILSAIFTFLLMNKIFTRKLDFATAELEEIETEQVEIKARIDDATAVLKKAECDLAKLEETKNHLGDQND